MTEALLSVTITTVAGAALLTSVGSSLGASRDAAHSLIARGLAEQLLEEIAATRFPTAASTRPASKVNRLQFDELDDYDAWTARPPTTRAGLPVGTELSGATATARDARLQSDPRFLARFTQEAQVERLLPDGNGGWTTTTQLTDYRRVTVRIRYTDAQNTTTLLAQVSRVFSYVPLTP